MPRAIIPEGPFRPGSIPRRPPDLPCPRTNHGRQTGVSVTVPKESHSKPFPAQGYWRSEAFFFGGVGGLPLLLRFLSGLDPRGLPVFWLPFATHIYFPTITSACTYLWASPNSPQSPQLSSQPPPPQPLRKALLPTRSLRLKPRCHAVAFTHPPPTSTLSPATTGLLS